MLLIIKTGVLLKFGAITMLWLSGSQGQSASRKHRMPCWEKKTLCHKPSVSDGNLTCVEPFRNKRHQKARRTPRFAKRCCASLSWPRSEFSICTNLKILSTCGQGHCTLGHIGHWERVGVICHLCLHSLKFASDRCVIFSGPGAFHLYSGSNHQNLLFCCSCCCCCLRCRG